MKNIRLLCKIVGCLLAFMVIYVVLIGGAHYLTGVYKSGIGTSSISYLHEMVIFAVLHLICATTIYLVLSKRLVSNASSPGAKMYPPIGRRARNSLLLALIPVLVSPAVVIGWIAFSGNQIEFNGIIRWQLLPVSLMLVAVGAAAEEVMFRGVLFMRLFQASKIPVWIGVIAQALAFSLLHGKIARDSWVAFLGFSVAGIFFGLACLLTQNIWLSTAIHAWLNIWSGLLGGSSVNWFVGTLLSEGGRDWVMVQRYGVLASTLLLLRVVFRIGMPVKVFVVDGKLG